MEKKGGARVVDTDLIKTDLEKTLIGKTIAEAQRLVKQNNFKMCISENNGIQKTVSDFDRKTCVITVLDGKVATAHFSKNRKTT